MFPEVAERLGVGGRTARAAYAPMRLARNWSLRAADCNVVLGERMSEFLATLGVPPERISVIPNWADGRSIAPVAHGENELRQRWGLTDCFVVGYSGNLGRAHEIDTILDAMARMARSQLSDAAAARTPVAPRITWLFVGGGSRIEELRVKVSAGGYGDVRFAPYQPREQLSISLSAADVHLVSLRPELEGLIVPSKFYGIAAAGRPSLFIGDRDGEIAHVVLGNDCGICVAQGDGAGLAECVATLASDPNRCAAMGRAARRVFETEFDKPVAVARWLAVLRMGETNEQGQAQTSIRRYLRR